MATIRRNWTYDDVEDADVHEFLESLPQRQVSKYIRIALRMLMQNMDEDGNIINSAPPINKKGNPTTKNQIVQENEDKFVNIDDDILNLGK